MFRGLEFWGFRVYGFRVLWVYGFKGSGFWVQGSGLKGPRYIIQIYSQKPDNPYGEKNPKVYSDCIQDP